MADGLGKQVGHGDILDLVAVLTVAGRDGVQEDHLVQHAVGDALDGRAGQHAVGGAGGHVLGVADLHQGLGGVAQGPAGVHHVVQQDDVLALDLADDVHHLRGVGLLAALVHNGQGHVQLLGEGPGTGHRAHVGGHHHGVVVAGGILLDEVVHKDGGAQQVVHRDVEEALDLVGVQVHGQHPVSAGSGDQVGHQLGRDGVAGLGLPVLTGIAEIGDHGGDPSGGGPLQGVDHNKQLHQRVVHRAGLAVLLKGAGGLDHKDVGAAHRLIDRGEVLPVGESAHLGIAQGDAQFCADVFGQLRIGISGKDLNILPVCDHVLSSHFVGAVRSRCGLRRLSFLFFWFRVPAQSAGRPLFSLAPPSASRDRPACSAALSRTL